MAARVRGPTTPSPSGPMKTNAMPVCARVMVRVAATATSGPMPRRAPGLTSSSKRIPARNGRMVQPRAAVRLVAEGRGVVRERARRRVSRLPGAGQPGIAAYRPAVPAGVPRTSRQARSPTTERRRKCSAARALICAAHNSQPVGRSHQVGDVGGEVGVGEFAVAGAQPELTEDSEIYDSDTASTTEEAAREA